MDPPQQELCVGGPHGKSKPLIENCANPRRGFAPFVFEMMGECAQHELCIRAGAPETLPHRRPQLEGLVQVLIFIMFCPGQAVSGSEGLVFAPLLHPGLLNGATPRRQLPGAWSP